MLVLLKSILLGVGFYWMLSDIKRNWWVAPLMVFIVLVLWR